MTMSVVQGRVAPLTLDGAFWKVAHLIWWSDREDAAMLGAIVNSGRRMAAIDNRANIVEIDSRRRSEESVNVN
jgi:hypothetical protein